MEYYYVYTYIEAYKYRKPYCVLVPVVEKRSNV